MPKDSNVATWFAFMCRVKHVSIFIVATPLCFEISHSIAHRRKFGISLTFTSPRFCFLSEICMAT